MADIAAKKFASEPSENDSLPREKEKHPRFNYPKNAAFS
jgi:hypothetical protein